jgi:hypothetical protein
MASLVAVALLAAAPADVFCANDLPARFGCASSDVEAQVQIPGVDINPTRWVQDAFGALLQSFSDGIRAGMDALWDANFITRTPPALTYQNADIRALYGTMQAAANAALATIATVGALNGLLRPHFRLQCHSLSEFVYVCWQGHPGQHGAVVGSVRRGRQQRPRRERRQCRASRRAV